LNEILAAIRNNRFWFYLFRELAEGLTVTTERNARNLQDAISLIGEIRTKLKVLENFYADSDSSNGGY
jgi:hypothetical protein